MHKNNNIINFILTRTKMKSSFESTHNSPIPSISIKKTISVKDRIKNPLLYATLPISPISPISPNSASPFAKFDKFTENRKNKSPLISPNSAKNYMPRSIDSQISNSNKSEKNSSALHNAAKLWTNLMHKKRASVKKVQTASNSPIKKIEDVNSAAREIVKPLSLKSRLYPNLNFSPDFLFNTDENFNRPNTKCINIPNAVFLTQSQQHNDQNASKSNSSSYQPPKSSKKFIKKRSRMLSPLFLEFQNNSCPDLSNISPSQPASENRLGNRRNSPGSFHWATHAKWYDIREQLIINKYYRENYAPVPTSKLVKITCSDLWKTRHNTNQRLLRVKRDHIEKNKIEILENKESEPQNETNFIMHNNSPEIAYKTVDCPKRKSTKNVIKKDAMRIIELVSKGKFEAEMANLQKETKRMWTRPSQYRKKLPLSIIVSGTSPRNTKNMNTNFEKAISPKHNNV